MKRYAAFSFATYYPSGGFDDFVGLFDTVSEAKAAVEAHQKNENNYEPRGQVVDLAEQKVVCRFDDLDGWYDEDE